MKLFPRQSFFDFLFDADLGFQDIGFTNTQKTQFLSNIMLVTKNIGKFVRRQQTCCKLTSTQCRSRCATCGQYCCANTLYRQISLPDAKRKPILLACVRKACARIAQCELQIHNEVKVRHCDDKVVQYLYLEMSRASFSLVSKSVIVQWDGEKTFEIMEGQWDGGTEERRDRDI